MPSYAHPWTLFRILILPAIIAFLYLYFYPAINDCAFPPAQRIKQKCSASGQCTNRTVNAGKPPFRLLALADPQLEGDTSLPPGWNDHEGAPASSLASGLWSGDWQKVDMLIKGYRKRLDLWGNDHYLAHIYKQTKWWAAPTHTVVLGDLLGSQWIGDEEFERRAERFWGRVFAGGERVDDADMWKEDGIGHDFTTPLTDEGPRARRWRKNVIAVAGNHDVGYAGDLNEARIERFERAFGRVNWEIAFRLPEATERSGQDYGSRKGQLDFYDGPGPQPEIRLVILNSMNLDEPAFSPALREDSLAFMEEKLCKPVEHTHAHAHSATVLLTHIPLHKASGVCTDGPFFSYFSPENRGGVREQNHLSEDISKRLLDCLAAGGPSSIVLNGHDHEGCDTYHYSILSTSQDALDVDKRNVVRQSQFGLLSREEKASAIREITVRSMMGSYGGYAGFLSGWFDQDEGKWRFEYETCGFGVQHIWWGCNVVLLLEVGLGVISLLDVLAGKYLEPEEEREKVKKA